MVVLGGMDKALSHGWTCYRVGVQIAGVESGACPSLGYDVLIVVVLPLPSRIDAMTVWWFRNVSPVEFVSTDPLTWVECPGGASTRCLPVPQGQPPTEGRAAGKNTC